MDTNRILIEKHYLPYDFYLELYGNNTSRHNIQQASAPIYASYTSVPTRMSNLSDAYMYPMHQVHNSQRASPNTNTRQTHIENIMNYTNSPHDFSFFANELLRQPSLHTPTYTENISNRQNSQNRPTLFTQQTTNPNTQAADNTQAAANTPAVANTPAAANTQAAANAPANTPTARSTAHNFSAMLLANLLNANMPYDIEITNIPLTLPLNLPLNNTENTNIGLSASNINIISSVFKFEDITSSTNPNIHTDTACTICQVNFENVDICRRLLGCNHVFHLQCIDTWLCEKNTCPTCRFNYNNYNPNIPNPQTHADNENESESHDNEDDGNDDGNDNDDDNDNGNDDSNDDGNDGNEYDSHVISPIELHESFVTYNNYDNYKDYEEDPNVEEIYIEENSTHAHATHQSTPPPTQQPPTQQPPTQQPPTQQPPTQQPPTESTSQQTSNTGASANTHNSHTINRNDLETFFNMTRPLLSTVFGSNANINGQPIDTYFTTFIDNVNPLISSFDNLFNTSRRSTQTSNSSVHVFNFTA